MNRNKSPKIKATKSTPHPVQPNQPALRSKRGRPPLSQSTRNTPLTTDDGKKNDINRSDMKDDDFRAKTFLIFVDDPMSLTPFHVLQGCHILNIETKTYISNRYLNDSRRRRKYDIAFTKVFTFPCRVFAKSESKVDLVKLHKISAKLNEQYKMLMSCKVDVETAYEQLLSKNPRKVKDGIEYETGIVQDPIARENAPPDTQTSFSEADDDADDNINNYPAADSKKLSIYLSIYIYIDIYTYTFS